MITNWFGSVSLCRMWINLGLLIYSCFSFHNDLSSNLWFYSFLFFFLSFSGTNTGRLRFHHHRNCWGQAVLLCWGLPSTVPEQKPRWILWTGRHRCRVSDRNQVEGLDSQKTAEKYLQSVCKDAAMDRFERGYSLVQNVLCFRWLNFYQLTYFMDFFLHHIFYIIYFMDFFCPHFSDAQKIWSFSSLFLFLRISTCQMSPSDIA